MTAPAYTEASLKKMMLPELRTIAAADFDADDLKGLRKAQLLELLIDNIDELNVAAIPLQERPYLVDHLLDPFFHDLLRCFAVRAVIFAGLAFSMLIFISFTVSFTDFGSTMVRTPSLYDADALSPRTLPGRETVREKKPCILSDR